MPVSAPKGTRLAREPIIQSVGNALRLLETLAQTDQRTLSDLARQTGFHPESDLSTVGGRSRRRATSYANPINVIASALNCTCWGSRRLGLTTSSPPPHPT